MTIEFRELELFARRDILIGSGLALIAGASCPAWAQDEGGGGDEGGEDAGGDDDGDAGDAGSESDAEGAIGEESSAEGVGVSDSPSLSSLSLSDLQNQAVGNDGVDADTTSVAANDTTYSNGTGAIGSDSVEVAISSISGSTTSSSSDFSSAISEIIAGVVAALSNSAFACFETANTTSNSGDTAAATVGYCIALNGDIYQTTGAGSSGLTGFGFQIGSTNDVGSYLNGESFSVNVDGFGLGVSADLSAYAVSFGSPGFSGSTGEQVGNVWDAISNAVSDFLNSGAQMVESIEQGLYDMSRDPLSSEPQSFQMNIGH